MKSSWITDAACSVDKFFAVRWSETDQVALCAGCKVQTECLAEGLQLPPTDEIRAGHQMTRQFHDEARRGAGTVRVCPVCQTPFTVDPSSTRRYCCRSCAARGNTARRPGGRRPTRAEAA